MAAATIRNATCIMILPQERCPECGSYMVERANGQGQDYRLRQQECGHKTEAQSTNIKSEKG